MAKHYFTALALTLAFSTGAMARASETPKTAPKSTFHWTRLTCGSGGLALRGAGSTYTLICETDDKRFFAVVQALANPLQTGFVSAYFPSAKFATLNIFDDGTIAGSYLGGEVGYTVGGGLEYGWYKKVDFERKTKVGRARLLSMSLDMHIGFMGGLGGFHIIPVTRSP